MKHSTMKRTSYLHTRPTCSRSNAGTQKSWSIHIQSGSKSNWHILGKRYWENTHIHVYYSHLFTMQPQAIPFFLKEPLSAKASGSRFSMSRQISATPQARHVIPAVSCSCFFFQQVWRTWEQYLTGFCFVVMTPNSNNCWRKHGCWVCRWWTAHGRVRTDQRGLEEGVQR